MMFDRVDAVASTRSFWAIVVHERRRMPVIVTHVACSVGRVPMIIQGSSVLMSRFPFVHLNPRDRTNRADLLRRL
jgi:hypothetical protein